MGLIGGHEYGFSIPDRIYLPQSILYFTCNPSFSVSGLCIILVPVLAAASAIPYAWHKYRYIIKLID